jgi:hypothetical protein
MRIKFKYQYGLEICDNLWMQNSPTEDRLKEKPSFRIPEEFEMDFVPRIFDDIDLTELITKEQFDELKSIIRKNTIYKEELLIFGMEWEIPAKVFKVLIRKDEKGFYNEVYINLATFITNSVLINHEFALERDLRKKWIEVDGIDEDELDKKYL